jgi:hypothetical protein
MYKIQIPANWLFWYHYNESDTNICIGLQPVHIETLRKAGFNTYSYDLELPVRRAGEIIEHSDRNMCLAYCIFKEAADAIKFKFEFGDKIAIDLSKGVYDY